MPAPLSLSLLSRELQNPEDAENASRSEGDYAPWDDCVC